jgi:hypothetical protein
LDQQSRLSSHFSAKDHPRRVPDDDSSTDPGHQPDENSTSPSDDYNRRPSLSYPSDSSLASTHREELSSFVEPLQESPHGQSHLLFSSLPLTLDQGEMGHGHGTPMR